MSKDKRGWLERLQDRWKLTSIKDVIIVLIVFALTGTTVVVIKPYVISVFTGGEEAPLWFTILYYIFILPVYNLILLIYGAIFGKFDFFWKFERRFIKRIFKSKSKPHE